MLLDTVLQAVPSSIDKIKPWTEVIEHVVVTLASIIAGFWAWYRFERGRGFDSALSIDIQASPVKAHSVHWTFFDVILTNVGRVKLQAKPVPKNVIAYKDKDPLEVQTDSSITAKEVLTYSCSLIVKRLAHNVSDSRVDWFNQDHFDSEKQEVNLLTEYIAPDTTIPEFWMEPGEPYHLGVALKLATGTYLAKVTFVGARNNKEFWSRTTVVSVP